MDYYSGYWKKLISFITHNTRNTQQYNTMHKRQISIWINHYLNNVVCSIWRYFFLYILLIITKKSLFENYLFNKEIPLPLLELHSGKLLSWIFYNFYFDCTKVLLICFFSGQEGQIFEFLTLSARLNHTMIKIGPSLHYSANCHF